MKPVSDYDTSELCPDCQGASRKFVTRTYAHGCSDGPGSCANEMVFSRPDIKKETRITLKAMEDLGRLKDPERMAAAVVAMKAAENTPPVKQDYDKEGYSVG